MTRAGRRAQGGRVPRRRRTDSAHATLARRYHEALRRADVQEAERVVDQALTAGVAAAEIQSEVIHPAMRWVGELWERAEITVADEHLATAISQQALIRLYPALQVAAPRSRSTVLLAAVEGQMHTLGLRMVADVLEGAGYVVMYLGADVPTPSLVAMVAEHEPAVTGLGCTFAAGAGALVDALVGIAESGSPTRVLLGGSGVPAPVRDAGYPWLPSSAGVVAAVERLLESPPQELPAGIAVLARRDGASAPPGAADDGSTPDARLLSVVEEATEQSRRHARRAQEYRYLAFHDPITEMFNRRAFDDRLAEMTASAAEDVLLAIDLDHFKAVNDTHGHDAGDELLRAVGRAITSSLRPGDFAARTGGDEFAVLPARLPGRPGAGHRRARPRECARGQRRRGHRQHRPRPTRPRRPRRRAGRRRGPVCGQAGRPRPRRRHARPLTSGLSRAGSRPGGSGRARPRLRRRR
jgi:MerR family transcriptional regulator, light-induced transcriptional regulator